MWYDVVLFNYYEQFTSEIGCYVIIGKTFFHKVLDVILGIDETFGGRQTPARYHENEQETK